MFPELQYTDQDKYFVLVIPRSLSSFDVYNSRYLPHSGTFQLNIDLNSVMVKGYYVLRFSEIKFKNLFSNILIKSKNNR